MALLDADRVRDQCALRSDHRAQRFYAGNGYPGHLRRILFKDESGKRPVCALYRQRWQVEHFFKWVKQYLRIQAYSVSPRTR